MKPDSMNTNVQQLSVFRSGSGLLTNDDLHVAEEREQIAGMIKQPGDSQPEAAVEHIARSRRVPRYAATDSVCREDPW